MYKRISDYGVIGNLHSMALVGLDGSIDWCCLPFLDSSSVFAAILDENEGGHFSICPTGEWDSVSHYLKSTNILVTAFRTRGGEMVLTDFMPIVEPTGEEARHPELYRMVQVTAGEVEVQAEFFPRFGYGRHPTFLEEQNEGILARSRSDRHTFALCCSRYGFRVEGERGRAVWRLRRGDFIWFYLKYDEEVCRPFNPSDGGRALRATQAFWRNWVKPETETALDLGPFRESVERSALVLKLLQFQPTGSIAAAATTSLPEQIGGVRNWDYRFSWVRDTTFTLDALSSLGHLAETRQYLRWIEKLIAERGATLAVLYDLQGEEIREELILGHLEGYKGSRPVRIGNAAARQWQHDIYGEIMDAAFKLAQMAGRVGQELWPFLNGICETARARWREKDHGIWEVRGGRQHFVLSKVMCWVALDRGIRMAYQYRLPADLGVWERERDEIHREVLTRGWNDEKRSFVQHYDTDALDAGTLLLPIFGFLPFDDPRMLSTVEAIRRELGHEEFIHRYRPHQVDDGLPGDDGVFLLCSFWLINNLIGQGRLREAERLLYRMERVSNHLGLFAEEYDLRWQIPLGNFPQALTHIGYINSVVALCTARSSGRN